MAGHSGDVCSGLDFSAADFGKQPKTPSRWPHIKKRSTWKLFVSSKRWRLLLGSFPFEIVYSPKHGPQGAARFYRTVLESSDQINPNWTRVLDVNWSLFLARKVQPPLIYVEGDGRLKQHTIEQTHLLLFRVHLLFISPVYLSSRSSLVRHAGGLRSHEALGPS